MTRLAEATLACVDVVKEHAEGMHPVAALAWVGASMACSTLAVVSDEKLDAAAKDLLKNLSRLIELEVELIRHRRAETKH